MENQFVPDAPVTREQVAAILYRYTQYMKYDVAEGDGIANYTDVHQISEYALTAMRWANSTGLITGRTETELVPKGEATRAEVAAIIQRYIENVVSE